MEKFRLRVATAEDVDGIRGLIDASVRGLQAKDYSAAQIEGALATVFTVDSQLIADGTYFVAVAARGGVAGGGGGGGGVGGRCGGGVGGRKKAEAGAGAARAQRRRALTW